MVGTEDQFASRDGVEALVASLPEPKRLVLVEGADHFFTGKLDQVDRALTDWLKAQTRARARPT